MNMETSACIAALSLQTKEVVMNKPNIDWIIHMVYTTDEPGNQFIEYACNAHTHGMERYNHMDFQMVLADPDAIGYVLNTLGLNVQNGKQYKDGDLVDGLFQDCPVKLVAFEETGRTVLRVIIPDANNLFPEDKNCAYPYNIQMKPLEELYAT